MLSIVIPSYERTDLLHSCLRSVVAFAPLNTEIVVVDDGSTGACVMQAAQEYAGVRVVRLPRRRGFCVAANAGLRAASGDIVELLNDDTEVTAGWASAALAHFDDPRVAAVAPLVLRWPDGKRIDSAGDRYDVGGFAQKRGHGQAVDCMSLEPGPVFGASAAAALYRRHTILDVGAFPESFGAYFEDVDLSFRLQRAGYVVIFEPQARVRHRVSSSYGRGRRQLVQQQSCNEERVFWRNLPARALLCALPRHLAVVLAKAWRRCEEGTLAPFLCGRLRLFGEVGQLLRHRRQLSLLGATSDIADWHIESSCAKYLN